MLHVYAYMHLDDDIVDHRDSVFQHSSTWYAQVILLLTKCMTWQLLRVHAHGVCKVRHCCMHMHMQTLYDIFKVGMHAWHINARIPPSVCVCVYLQDMIYWSLHTRRNSNKDQHILCHDFSLLRSEKGTKDASAFRAMAVGRWRLEQEQVSSKHAEQGKLSEAGSQKMVHQARAGLQV